MFNTKHKFPIYVQIFPFSLFLLKGFPWKMIFRYIFSIMQNMEKSSRRKIFIFNKSLQTYNNFYIVQFNKNLENKI